MSEKPPKRFVAAKDFTSDDPDDLHFKVGEMVIATDYGDEDEWWYGEIEGSNGERVGCFIRDYVKPHGNDTPTDNGKKGEWRNYQNQPNKKGHVLSWGENTFGETWSRYEYERPDDTIDIHKSHQQWLKEEDEEKERQMYVEWEIWERDLPTGTKCDARLKHEAALRSAEEKKEEKRRAFSERRAAKKAAQNREQGAPPPPEPTPPPKPTPPPQPTRVEPLVIEPEPEPVDEKPAPLMEPDDSDEEVVVVVEEAAAPTTSKTASPSDTKAAIKAAMEALQNELEQMTVPDAQGISGFRYTFANLDQEDRMRFQTESCDAARENPSLNRYKDILPYDSARVQLNVNNPGLDNYINASRIKNLLPGSPEYFTAQGPKPATISHFWKMVAQYRTGVVVMVTRCKEMERVKCEQYWPTEAEGAVHFEADDSGPAVSVIANGETEFDAWVERKFTILQASGSFDIVQLHFEDWPDHGVPTSPKTLIDFIHKTMQYQRDYRQISKLPSSTPCPIVVHCSAGVGRTGVWVTLYSILTYFPYMRIGDHVDILAMVKKLRTCRRYMVQTVQQFEFCFQAAIYAAGEFLKALETGGLEHSQRDAKPDAATVATQMLQRAVNVQLQQSLAREKTLVDQMFQLRATIASFASLLPAPGSNPMEAMQELEEMSEKCTRYEDQLQDQIIANHQKDLVIRQKDTMLESCNRQIFDLDEKLEDAQNDNWQAQSKLEAANTELAELKLADQIVRLDVSSPIESNSNSNSVSTTEQPHDDDDDDDEQTKPQTVEASVVVLTLDQNDDASDSEL